MKTFFAARSHRQPVSNHHSFATFAVQFLTFLIWHPCKRFVSEGTELFKIWLHFQPAFRRSHVFFQCARWTPIKQVCSHQRCFQPQPLRCVGINEHRPHLFNQRSVGAFCCGEYAIVGCNWIPLHLRCLLDQYSLP